MVRRLVLVLALLVGVASGTAVPASAAVFPDSIPLPVDFAPEGIAMGAGTTFYVGSLTSGDIYRGDLRTGAGGIFIDAPPESSAVGMKVDLARRLLFVSGGFSGQARVYSTRSGALVATYNFGTPGASLLNDVVLTRAGAFFTDSFAPQLYQIPFGPGLGLGAGRTIALSGPATFVDPTFPNLNGIAATADGSRLIVGHTALTKLFTVDPRTGASAEIAVDGLVPRTLDGLVVLGPFLFVVENFANTVARVHLSHDLTSGAIEAEITSPIFRVPTTAALFGGRLVLVNGRFDLGIPPPLGPGAPDGTDYDVVTVRAF